MTPLLVLDFFVSFVCCVVASYVYVFVFNISIVYIVVCCLYLRNIINVYADVVFCVCCIVFSLWQGRTAPADCRSLNYKSNQINQISMASI